MGGSAVDIVFVAPGRSTSSSVGGVVVIATGYMSKVGGTINRCSSSSSKIKPK